MSAGTFSDTAYSTDAGNFYPVRVQPETFTLTINSVANDAPTGPVPTGTPGLKLTKGNREAGIVARKVRFRITDVNPPANYAANSILSLPVLTKAAYDSWGKGNTGTYTLNGIAYSVAYVGKSPERIN